MLLIVLITFNITETCKKETKQLIQN